MVRSSQVLMKLDLEDPFDRIIYPIEFDIDVET